MTCLQRPRQALGRGQGKIPDPSPPCLLTGSEPGEREVREGVEQLKRETKEAGATPLRDGGVPSWRKRAALRQRSKRQPAQGDGQGQQQARQTLWRADADVLEAEAGLAIFEAFLDGLFTNDKFCLSRFGQLSLTWWRYPLRLRGRHSDAQTAFPGEVAHRGGSHETAMAHSPADMKQRWRIRRQTCALSDGQRRWDRAYQAILEWAATGEGDGRAKQRSPTATQAATQEVAHAEDWRVRARLDGTAGRGVRALNNRWSACGRRWRLMSGRSGTCGRSTSSVTTASVARACSGRVWTGCATQ
jgi:hypothetical protein